MRFRSLKDVENFVNSDHPDAAQHRAAVRKKRYGGTAVSPSAAAAVAGGGEGPSPSPSHKAVAAVATGGSLSSPTPADKGKGKDGGDKKVRGKYKKREKVLPPTVKRFTKDGARIFSKGGKSYVKIKDRLAGSAVLPRGQKGGKEGYADGGGGGGDSKTGLHVKRKYTKKSGPKMADVTKGDNQEQQQKGANATNKSKPKLKKTAIATAIEEWKHNNKQPGLTTTTATKTVKMKKTGISKEIQDYLAVPGSGDDLGRMPAPHKKRKKTAGAEGGGREGEAQRPKKKSKVAAASAAPCAGTGTGMGLPRSPTASTASPGNVSIMSDGGGSGEEHKKKRGRPLGSKNKKSKDGRGRGGGGGNGDESAKAARGPRKQQHPAASPKGGDGAEGLPAGKENSGVKKVKKAEDDTRTRDSVAESVRLTGEDETGPGRRSEGEGAGVRGASAGKIGGVRRESSPEARKESSGGVVDAALSAGAPPLKPVKGAQEEGEQSQEAGGGGGAGEEEATLEGVSSPKEKKRKKPLPLSLSLPERRHSAGDASKGKKGSGGDASSLPRDAVRSRNRGGRPSLPAPSPRNVDGGGGGSRASVGGKGKGKGRASAAKGKVKRGGGDAEAAPSDDNNGAPTASMKKQKKRASTTPLRQSSRAAAAAATAALTEVFDKRSYPTTSAIPGGSEGGRNGWGAWYS